MQQAQEGTTGFLVRGGNTDQNLVQLDEATVYNPNHLFGLVSTFNVNSINNVQLIKGGFPGHAVLVATHDRELIRRVGRRSITLDHGRIVEVA